MFLHQIYTGSSLRNFTYVLASRDGQRVYCVDPFDAAQLSDFLGERGLRPTHIINTHEHHDHVEGNSGLLERFPGIEVLAHERAAPRVPGFRRALKPGERLPLDSDAGCELEVLDTPGHTFAHVSLLVRDVQGVTTGILTGDTLFNAGVGRCDRGGDPDTLYETIRDRFGELADDVRVYPGHEYMGTNLKFTLSHEPENQAARQLLQDYEQAIARGEYLISTMGLERQMNTFLRLDSPDLRRELGRRFAEIDASAGDRAVFLRLRRLRDVW